MFCATNTLGNTFPNLLVRSVYRFHRYFLPHENGFSKFTNAYIKSAYYSICDYGVNADETWRNSDWFYTTKYGIFGYGGWIVITQSKGFTRKGIQKVRRSVRKYFCLALPSQVQATSSIMGNSVSTVDAQQVFNSVYYIDK